MISQFKVKVIPALFVILFFVVQLMAEKEVNADIAEAPPSIDTASLSSGAAINQDEPDFIALPNPVRNRNEKVVLMCRTRCVGTALLNIYDAVGSVVFQKTIALQQPDAVGHKMCISWDCRNRKGRFVGNGTYLGVISLFDTENRPIARHKINIGVAY
ncbi:MAG: hypothetical protein JW913_09100 [Chitinispirillaceae bacterium]|nr:hypothetical protein [Chitinispirillaceae bacterium]